MKYTGRRDIGFDVHAKVGMEALFGEASVARPALDVKVIITPPCISLVFLYTKYTGWFQTVTSTARPARTAASAHARTPHSPSPSAPTGRK